MLPISGLTTAIGNILWLFTPPAVLASHLGSRSCPSSSRLCPAPANAPRRTLVSGPLHPCGRASRVPDSWLWPGPALVCCSDLAHGPVDRGSLSFSVFLSLLCLLSFAHSQFLSLVLILMFSF